MDWSDADIVFINNVLLSPETMLKVERRAKALQAGTRLVTYQPLVGSDFELAKALELSTSWGSSTAAATSAAATSAADTSAADTSAADTSAADTSAADTSASEEVTSAPERTSTYYYYRKVSPPSLEGDVEPAIRVCSLHVGAR